MICDLCHQKPAAMHFTKIINGHKTEINLCQDCASKSSEFSFGFIPQISLPGFLAGLFQNDVNIDPWSTNEDQIKCPNCGMSYHHFTKTGLLGCSKCYDVFSRETEPLLRKIHGSTHHGGKVPQRGGGQFKVKREIESLKNQLQQAIKNEEFEKAAQLRDRIKELAN